MFGKTYIGTILATERESGAYRRGRGSYIWNFTVTCLSIARFPAIAVGWFPAFGSWVIVSLGAWHHLHDFVSISDWLISLSAITCIACCGRSLGQTVRWDILRVRCIKNKNRWKKSRGYLISKMAFDLPNFCCVALKAFGITMNTRETVLKKSRWKKQSFPFVSVWFAKSLKRVTQRFPYTQINIIRYGIFVAWWK